MKRVFERRQLVMMRAIVLSLFCVGCGSKTGLDERSLAPPEPVFDPCANPDADGDGAISSLCGGDDCDDTNMAVHPGSVELCNGVDDNCDGRVDEGFDVTSDLECTVRDIDSGYRFVCIVLGTSEVLCWGDCDRGETGRGEVEPSGGRSCGPAPVVGLSEARQVECALSGSVRCWGWNVGGQLGDGTLDHGSGPGMGDFSLVPTTVRLDEPASWISTDSFTGCAVVAGGRVFCWGTGPVLGAGGPGAFTCYNALDEEYDCSPFPVDIGLERGAVEVVVGGSHACARTTAGQVYCWGTNHNGELGDGRVTHGPCPNSDEGDCSLVPVLVRLPGTTAELALGYHFSCARLADGRVFCWGSHHAGTLGDGSYEHEGPECQYPIMLEGTFDCAWSPVEVAGLDDAVEISAGYAHVCARRSTGEVVCWGDNFHGQLGIGDVDEPDEFATPQDVVGLHDAMRIAAGSEHTCAVRESGELLCWGSNISCIISRDRGSYSTSEPTVVDWF